MNSWRSNAILALQISGELSLSDAVAADAIGTLEDGTSPLIELVSTGILPDEALAQALTQSSGRPRLRWNMLTSFGLEQVYADYQNLCSRYQAIPLLYEAEGYLALAMVDPSWTRAAQAFEAHFGVAVYPFVISHTDYLYLSRPEFRPNPEDYFEFGETLDDSTPTELVDLIRTLQKGTNLGVGESNDRVAPSTALPATLVGGPSAFDRIAPLPPADATLGDAAATDVEEAARAVAENEFYAMAKELGYETDEEREEFLLRGVTPSDPVRILQTSQAFDTSGYAVNEAIPSMQALIERILEGPVSKETWRDLFDVFSLIGCACVLGLRNEKEMFLQDLWIDGAEVARRDWALVGQMLHRVFPHQASNLHVLQLDPRHRDELNIAAFVGTNVLLCTSPCSDGSVAFFGLIGLPGEWIRELNAFMTGFSRGRKVASLLNSVSDPGTRLIHVV